MVAIFSDQFTTPIGCSFISKKFKILKTDVVSNKFIRFIQSILLIHKKSNIEILFINVHGNHNYDTKELIKLLNIVIKKYNTSNIIITGDFNMVFYNDYLSLEKLKLNIYKSTYKTCCSYSYGHPYVYDYIMYTKFKFIESFQIYSDYINTSDHKPVGIKLKL